MRKTPNKIAYVFSPRRSLDLSSTVTQFDTYMAHAEIADIISFALTNHKEHYNRSH